MNRIFAFTIKDDTTGEVRSGLVRAESEDEALDVLRPKAAQPD